MIVASSHGSAGPLGLLVILLIGVATVFLIRNMNGRLRKLPREFPEQPPRKAERPEDPPAEDVVRS